MEKDSIANKGFGILLKLFVCCFAILIAAFPLVAQTHDSADAITNDIASLTASIDASNNKKDLINKSIESKANTFYETSYQRSMAELDELTGKMKDADIETSKKKREVKLQQERKEYESSLIAEQSSAIQDIDNTITSVTLQRDDLVKLLTTKVFTVRTSDVKVGDYDYAKVSIPLTITIRALDNFSLAIDYHLPVTKDMEPEDVAKLSDSVATQDFFCDAQYKVREDRDSAGSYSVFLTTLTVLDKRQQELCKKTVNAVVKHFKTAQFSTGNE